MDKLPQIDLGKLGTEGNVEVQVFLSRKDAIEQGVMVAQRRKLNISQLGTAEGIVEVPEVDFKIAEEKLFPVSADADASEIRRSLADKELFLVVKLWKSRPLVDDDLGTFQFQCAASIKHGPYSVHDSSGGYLSQKTMIPAAMQYVENSSDLGVQTNVSAVWWGRRSISNSLP